MSQELRKQLENKIVHRGDDVHLMLPNMGVGDLDTTYYKAYIDAWKQLHEYYKENHDSEISLSILEEISFSFRVLNAILAEASPDQKARVQEALNEFDSILNSIVMTDYFRTNKSHLRFKTK